METKGLEREKMRDGCREGLRPPSDLLGRVRGRGVELGEALQRDRRHLSAPLAKAPAGVFQEKERKREREKKRKEKKGKRESEKKGKSEKGKRRKR